MDLTLEVKCFFLRKCKIKDNEMTGKNILGASFFLFNLEVTPLPRRAEQRNH